MPKFGINVEYTAKVSSRTLTPGRVKTIMRNALRRANYSTLELYEGTVETWEHKPKFLEHVSVQADYIEARVGIDPKAETPTSGVKSTNTSSALILHDWFQPSFEKEAERPTAEEVYRFVDEGTDPHDIPNVIPAGKTGTSKTWVGLSGEIQFDLRKSEGLEGGSGVLRFQVGGFAPKTSPFSLVSGKGSKADNYWVNADEVRHPGIRARNFTEKITKFSIPVYREEARRGMAQIAKEFG